MIGLLDSLNVGPIDPPHPDLRRAWLETVLLGEVPLDDLDIVPGDSERAWAHATSPFVHPGFWACMDCPMKHACLLAFATRMQDRPFDIVDATGIVTAAKEVRSPVTSSPKRASGLPVGVISERRGRLVFTCISASASNGGADSPNFDSIER